MSDDEKLRQEIEEIFVDFERKTRQARQEKRQQADEVMSPLQGELRTPTWKLTVQALNAFEIREELEEAVTLSTEEFTAWALERLSPYSSALILAEAEMATVKHNLKSLFQEGR